MGLKFATVLCAAIVAWAAAGEERKAALDFDGKASVIGMKCTENGAPNKQTEKLDYLDPFVLEFKLKGGGKPEEKLTVAAWFGRAAAGQLNATFTREDDRGKPYEIVDAAGKVVPPQQPDGAMAIAFHGEASNFKSGRANLSKGIGGQPIPAIAAAGKMRLYSSMHQRFSFSLVAVSKADFKKYGARYSIEQLAALPAGVYQLRLPFTIALIGETNKVVSVQHGETKMKLDLSEAKREATIESFKGSGSPRVIFE